MAEAGDVAVIHGQPVMDGDDPPLGRKLVIVVVAAAARAKGALMVIQVPLGIGTAQAQPRNAHVGSEDANHDARVEVVTVEQRAGAAVHAAIPGQGNAARHFQHQLLNIDEGGQVYFRVVGDKHHLSRFRILQRRDEFLQRFGGMVSGCDGVHVSRAPADGAAFIRLCAVNHIVQDDEGGFVRPDDGRSQ